MTKVKKAERGIALLVTIFTLTLVSALAAAVVLTTSSEAMIAGNFRRSAQAKYAAGAAAEWTLAELAVAADWPAIAGGSELSSFVDGPADGVRRLSSGLTVDLTALLLASPGWHLYAFGPLSGLVPVPDGSHFYIAALVSPGTSPDRLNVRAIAFGPFGARQAIEVTAIQASGGVHTEGWAFTR